MINSFRVIFDEINWSEGFSKPGEKKSNCSRCKKELPKNQPPLTTMFGTERYWCSAECVMRWAAINTQLVLIHIYAGKKYIGDLTYRKVINV